MLSAKKPAKKITGLVKAATKKPAARKTTISKAANKNQPVVKKSSKIFENKYIGRLGLHEEALRKIEQIWRLINEDSMAVHARRRRVAANKKRVVGAKIAEKRPAAKATTKKLHTTQTMRAHTAKRIGSEKMQERGRVVTKRK